ncbi:MAG: DUF2933 domain-containing protein [Actinomycetota bacterium]
MKSMLRCCLNWKVLTGLGVAAVAVWAVRPDLIRSVLPSLVVLVCPLSMVLMMLGMRGRGSAEPSNDAELPQPTVTKHRVTELRERLERARAEESVLSSELARLQPLDVSSDEPARAAEPRPADPPVTQRASAEDA